jgi:hypothetical protein
MDNDRIYGKLQADLVVGLCRYTRLTLWFRTRMMNGMNSRGGPIFCELFVDFCSGVCHCESFIHMF